MEVAKTKISNNAWLIIGIIVIILAIAAFIIFKIFVNPPANSQLIIGNSPVLGEENAPVTIYEFSDFSCPYCAAAEGANQQAIDYLKGKMPQWEAPMPKIKEQYVKTGKVKIVFKYFPGHGSGVAAHAVAFGLKEQNSELFWKFAEKAFANQENLNDFEQMKAWAQELGADMDALSEYLSSNKYALQMKEDEDLGVKNKVQGTPTFFINGKIVSGAQSFSVFEEAIEQELSKIS